MSKQNMSKKVICVIGTRPEAIKMAPVILALKDCPNIDCRVLATAQHRHMLQRPPIQFSRLLSAPL